jgi:hypothetical protein
VNKNREQRLVLNEPLYHQYDVVQVLPYIEFFSLPSANWGNCNAPNNGQLTYEFDFLVRNVAFFPELSGEQFWELIVNQRAFIRSWRSLALVSPLNVKCPDLGAVKLDGGASFAVRLYKPTMERITCELRGLKIYNGVDCRNFVHADEEPF